jgi:hypothetical protein
MNGSSNVETKRESSSLNNRKEKGTMKNTENLTSEQLRELNCAPENTDDFENIDFDDEDY